MCGSISCFSVLTVVFQIIEIDTARISAGTCSFFFRRNFHIVAVEVSQKPVVLVRQRGFGVFKCMHYWFTEIFCRAYFTKKCRCQNSHGFRIIVAYHFRYFFQYRYGPSCTFVNQSGIDKIDCSYHNLHPHDCNV